MHLFALPKSAGASKPALNVSHHTEFLDTTECASGSTITAILLLKPSKFSENMPVTLFASTAFLGL